MRPATAAGPTSSEATHSFAGHKTSVTSGQQAVDIVLKPPADAAKCVGQTWTFPPRAPLSATAVARPNASFSKGTLQRLFGWQHGASKAVRPAVIFRYTPTGSTQQVSLPAVWLLPPSRDDADRQGPKQEGAPRVKVDGYSVPTDTLRAMYAALGVQPGGRLVYQSAGWQESHIVLDVFYRPPEAAAAGAGAGAGTHVPAAHAANSSGGPSGMPAAAARAPAAAPIVHAPQLVATAVVAVAAGGGAPSAMSLHPPAARADQAAESAAAGAAAVAAAGRPHLHAAELSGCDSEVEIMEVDDMLAAGTLPEAPPHSKQQQLAAAAPAELQAKVEQPAAPPSLQRLATAAVEALAATAMLAAGTLPEAPPHSKQQQLAAAAPAELQTKVEQPAAPPSLQGLAAAAVEPLAATAAAPAAAAAEAATEKPQFATVVWHLPAALKAAPGHAAAAVPLAACPDCSSLARRIISSGEAGWLSTEQVHELMTHAEEYRLPITADPPFKPTPGCMFLTELSKRMDREDGYMWTDRRASKLKVDGREVLQVVYHLTADKTLQRRAYHFMDKGGPHAHLQLLHYQVPEDRLSGKTKPGPRLKRAPEASSEPQQARSSKRQATASKSVQQQGQQPLPPAAAAGDGVAKPEQGASPAAMATTTQQVPVAADGQQQAQQQAGVACSADALAAFQQQQQEVAEQPTQPPGDVRLPQDGSQQHAQGQEQRVPAAAPALAPSSQQPQDVQQQQGEKRQQGLSGDEQPPAAAAVEDAVHSLAQGLQQQQQQPRHPAAAARRRQQQYPLPLGAAVPPAARPPQLPGQPEASLVGTPVQQHATDHGTTPVRHQPPAGASPRLPPAQHAASAGAAGPSEVKQEVEQQLAQQVAAAAAAREVAASHRFGKQLAEQHLPPPAPAAAGQQQAAVPLLAAAAAGQQPPAAPPPAVAAAAGQLSPADLAARAAEVAAVGEGNNRLVVFKALRPILERCKVPGGEIRMFLKRNILDTSIEVCGMHWSEIAGSYGKGDDAGVVQWVELCLGASVS